MPPARNRGIDIGSGTFSYATSMSDSTNGPLGLVVLGSGTLALGGTGSTYSGGTMIIGATLQVWRHLLPGQ